MRGIRIITVCALLLSYVLAPAPAQAALAQGNVDPWFISPDSAPSTTVPRSGTLARSFGALAITAVDSVTITMNTANLNTSKVTVSAVSGLCSRSGTRITCTFGPLDAGERGTASVTFTPVAGVAGGSAGSVNVAVTSASPAAPAKDLDVNITLSYGPTVADIASSSTKPSGNVGDIVTVTTTFTNHGPGFEPYASVGGSDPAGGIEFVGGTGCTGTREYECRVNNIAVGQTVTIKQRFRITSCNTDGDPNAWMETAYEDPTSNNDDFGLAITRRGCSGSGSGGSAGGSGSGGGGSGSVTPKPTATVASGVATTAPDTPAVTDGAVTASPDTTVAPLAYEVANETAAGSDDWLVGVVVAVMVLALGGAAVLFVRRRRPTGAEGA